MIAHGTTALHLPHGHPIATIIVIVLFVGLCAYWGYTSSRNKIY